MKQLRITSTRIIYGCVLLFFVACSKSDPHPPQLNVSTLATGFTSPNGMAMSGDGQIWLADQGTGKNDGKVWLIKPNGEKFEAIVHLESVLTGNELDGPSHMLFSDGLLYILGAKGKMYKARPADFKPGGPSIEASTLEFEDISAFVLSYPFIKNTHMCHPYGITKAPDGSFYITDAAANALLHRTKGGVYSVVAEIPGVENPFPMGPPVTESVPTGVIFRDGNLLVTTLLGFPFPPGRAVIYQVTPQGWISVYQKRFFSLVDIIDGNSKGQLILEHGHFNFGSMGFTPKTGKLLWADGKEATTFVDSLNLPAAVVQGNKNTWYVSSLGDKSVIKVTYR
jgi:hypothetical protein